MKKYLAILFLLSAVFIGGCMNNNKIDICEQAVLKDLKAPGSAVFGNKPIVAKDTIHGYTIKNYVDSQNSYGALLRSEFICRFDMNDSVKFLFRDDSVDGDNSFYESLNETRFSSD